MNMIRVRRGLVHCSWFEDSRICTQSRDFVLNNKCECWVFKNRRRFFSFSDCWKTRNCARSFLVPKAGYCSILRWLLLSFANVTKAGVPLITKDTVVRWSYLWQFKEPPGFWMQYLVSISTRVVEDILSLFTLSRMSVEELKWLYFYVLGLLACLLLENPFSRTLAGHGYVTPNKLWGVRWSERSWKQESMQVQESVMQEFFLTIHQVW